LRPRLQRLGPQAQPVLRKVSFRIVTMPVQSQGIITRDNVSALQTQLGAQKEN
jgi:hypothetical protein